mgnify:CR=1 FL=1
MDGSSNILSGNRFSNHTLGSELLQGEHNRISNNCFFDTETPIQIDLGDNGTTIIEGSKLIKTQDSLTALTPTPTIPESSWLAIIPLLLSVFSVAVIVRHRKTNKLNQ